MDVTLTAPAGISVRPARPSDLPALRDLFDRCSPETLYKRFHGVAGLTTRREMDRIASPTPTHRSWVAVGPDGAVHGTATLAWGRAGEVEVAFLVEDGHRRRGIGRALVAAAGREAAARGVPEVRAVIQGDNVGASRFLRAVVPDVSLRFADGMTVGSIPVAPRPATPSTLRPGRAGLRPSTWAGPRQEVA